MIIGFGLAVWGSNIGRLRMTDVNIDCLHGVWIDHSSDITYLTRVHCWPFSHAMTGAAISSGDAALHRSGTAFYTTRLNDWTKITNCFSYGYYRGFELQGGDEMVLTNCGADNTGNHAGSMGFRVAAASNTHLIGCQSAGNQNGYYMETATNINTRMTSCDAWGCNDNGVAVLSGSVAIFGGGYRGCGNGIVRVAGNVYASGLSFFGAAGTAGGNTANNVLGTILAMPTSYTF
jgi:hypothetical protein